MKATKIPRSSFPKYIEILQGKNKGKKININLMYLKYDTLVNVDTLEFGKDSGGEEINTLIQKGIVKDCHYGIVVDLTYDWSTTQLSEQELKQAQESLTAQSGIKVSMSAIKYCYNAWKHGFKSGYRGKGFHLFTPCSINPLSFRLTSLDKHFRDWQTTYVC